MAIRKVVKDTDLGGYMDYNGIEANKLNPVLPAINEVALATTPITTGNVTNRNEFVIAPNGEGWFIDYAGDGKNLGHKNGINFFNALSSVFPAIAQTNTTRVNIPGWSFPVVASKSYEIKVLSTYTAAVNTTGGSMGLITSGGAVGNIHGYFEADVSSNVSAIGLKIPVTIVNTVNTTVNSFITSTSSTTGQAQSINLYAVFNCTTSGNINIQWGTEIANSLAQLRIGSSLIVNLLN
jgi:hypothetical protein